MKPKRAELSYQQEVKNILGRLYPDENINQRYRIYQIRKFKTVLAVTLFGIGACICAYVSSRMQSRLQEGTHLYRNEWGEGSYEVVLSAVTGFGEETVTYEIKERQYTEQELLVMQKEVVERLPSVIVGENESLQCVRRSLNLPSQLTGYPFTIAWKSSDYDKVRTDGMVNLEEVSAEGEVIILTAILSCQNQRWQQAFEIRIFPEILSAEEERMEEVNRLLEESDEVSKSQSKMILPAEVGREKIVWKENLQSGGTWFLVLGILGAVASALAMDRDLRKRDKERKEELAKCYPEFISRLQLYMGAGLTIRNAFFRIGSDYQRGKSIVGKKQFLYEEVLISCYQLSNGKPEDMVYREWANRCDEIHYRKLGFLLVSYWRQGNDNILRRLSKEVYLAWEERKNQSKKQGDEAGTKLLFPMILMLMVVMFLILVPVYVGF